MGFHDTLMMLLTMEADCIKEEFYHYFGLTTDVPSKVAFYRQRCKLTGDALDNLLYTFNSRLQKNLYNRKYQFIACDGSAADIFHNPDDADSFLNLMANLQRTSTRSISMPSIPYWTGASPTLWSSLPGRGTNMSLSAGWWMLPGAMDPPPYISLIWVTLPTIILPMSLSTNSSSSSAAMTKGWEA